MKLRNATVTAAALAIVLLAATAADKITLKYLTAWTTGCGERRKSPTSLATW